MALACLLLMLGSVAQQARADAPLAPAEAALQGTLTSIGSDTLGHLMSEWAAAFQQAHPGSVVQVQTPGSASAPQALITGAASFGAMSRAMNEEETQRFSARFGYAPARVTVARDAIVVVVHPDNPLSALSLAEVAMLFAAPGSCGVSQSIERWGDLAAFDTARGSALASQPILRVGRNNASGTAAFFRSASLCEGEFRADVVQWPGSGAVIAAVATQANAIGYAGIGYVNGLVKVLAISAQPGAAAVGPDAQTILAGRYALARPLYLYFNLAPNAAPAPLSAAFLRFVLSDAGQAIASREGFLAESPAARRAQLVASHLAPQDQE